MDSNLAYRCDHRTKAQFSDDVDYSTAREGRLVRKWAETMLSRGFFSSLDVADHGMDNSGKLVTDAAKTSRAADFAIAAWGGSLLPDGEHLVEVKYTPCLWKATFKVGDLKSYAHQGAHILLVCGSGPENPSCWTLITPDQICIILADLLSTAGNNNPGMGGKLSILIRKNLFKKYFGTFYPW